MSVPTQKRLRRTSPPIVHLTADEMAPGRLGTLFQNGAKAVVLRGDPRISGLWQSIVMPHMDAMGTSEIDLLSLCQNHQSGDSQRGEMLNFVPGRCGNISRKVQITLSRDGQSMNANPNGFWEENKFIPLRSDLLETTFALASDLLLSILPQGMKPAPYTTDFQLLRYPSSSADLDRLSALIADAGTGYTRIGHQIDTYRAMASGFLQHKGPADLFALGYLIPVLRPALRLFNRFAQWVGNEKIPKDFRVIGNSHVDVARPFVALASERDVVTTQIYDGRRWIELPLQSDALAIFPGRTATSRKLGIAPTYHRVLLDKRVRPTDTTKPNVTLRISVLNQRSVHECTESRRSEWVSRKDVGAPATIS